MRKNILTNAIKYLAMLAILIAGIMMIPVSALAYNALDEDDPDLDRKNPDTGYRVIIYDGAELLDSDEMRLLAEDMAGITQWGDVAFVSTDHDDYKDIMRYSEAMFYKLFDDDDNAIMLIIDMDEREISIFSDGDIHKVITDAYGYDITDNICLKRLRADLHCS